MPELRDLYDREVVAGQITPPTFAYLQDRARRRARRNGVAGAAVLVALVVGVLLVVQGAGDQRTAPPVQTPSPSPAPSEPAGFPRAVEVYLSRLQFVDLDHGYAEYQAEPSDDECRAWLLVTEDGGQTWSEPRELPEPYHEPAEDIGSCSSVDLVPVTPRTLVLQLHRPADLDDPISYDHFLSRDAGRSWTPYQPEVRVADTVPEGVIPVKCVEDCPEPSLSWYDQHSGDRMMLRANPPGMSEVSWGGGETSDIAADGSIWVTGLDSSYEYWIAVSLDRGRSWQTHPLGRLVDPTQHDGGASFATHDGVTAYFSAWERTGPEEWSASFSRTTDGGQTWQRMAVEPPFPQTPPTMWVALDGTLVIVDDGGGHYASSDRGETFRPIDLPVSGAIPIADGYFSYGSSTQDQPGIDGYLSRDGLTWRPVQAPRP